VIEDLNSGLKRNKSRQWQGGGLEPGQPRSQGLFPGLAKEKTLGTRLEPGTSGLQHERPKPLGHTASGHVDVILGPIIVKSEN